MSDSRALRPDAVAGQIMSAFAETANAAEKQGLSAIPLGQRCPHRCPQHCPYLRGPTRTTDASSLGPAMKIADVADLLGCSPWTVRQKYLSQGLPHVRASEGGKIVFFREQVIHWILNRQQQERRNRP